MEKKRREGDCTHVYQYITHSIFWTLKAVPDTMCATILYIAKLTLFRINGVTVMAVNLTRFSNHQVTGVWQKILT